MDLKAAGVGVGDGANSGGGAIFVVAHRLVPNHRYRQ